MSEETKLLPCPFCLEDMAQMGGRDDAQCQFYQVFCMKCGSNGPHNKKNEEALSAWNRRAPAGDSVEGVATNYLSIIQSDKSFVYVPKEWIGKRVRVTLLEEADG